MKCGLYFYKERNFFELLAEHLKISAVAILIAIVFGGLVGILISEYQKSAKSTLGVINFLYTIPSFLYLGFLIPFSGVRKCDCNHCTDYIFTSSDG